MFFADELYSELRNIDLKSIDPDPNQPRRSISSIYGEMPSDIEEIGRIVADQPDPEIDADLKLDDESDRPGAENISSLADSILANGVLQPITVRPHGKRRFMIVTGERRWRAAVAVQKRIKEGLVDQASLRPDYDFGTIPAIITKTKVSDEDRLSAQLVENIQRTGMQFDDIGVALMKLRDRGMSIRDIAAKLGRSTAFVQSALCAASEDGKSVAAELRTTDWQWVRRMITRKREAPEVYKAILQRVRNGETFSRAMYESVNSSFKEQKEFRTRASLRSRFGNRPPPAPPGSIDEDDDRPGPPMDLSDDPEPAVEFDRPKPPSKVVAQARPEFVEKNKALATQAEQFEAMYAYGYNSFIAYFESGDEDDHSLDMLLPEDEEPPEPTVDILVRLPRSEADLLAGVLDAVLVEIKKQGGLPNRRIRAVPGEKGSAIAERVKNLVKAFG